MAELDADAISGRKWEGARRSRDRDDDMVPVAAVVRREDRRSRDAP